jgi:hypothetical protein
VHFVKSPITKIRLLNQNVEITVFNILRYACFIGFLVLLRIVWLKLSVYEVYVSNTAVRSSDPTITNMAVEF